MGCLKRVKIEDLENEIWKDIKGFEGKYQISNFGRVKSLERQIIPTSPYQKSKRCRTRILKICIGAHGYFHVSLSGRKYCIHRLLAETFIENPDNLKCVNHKDGNKLNNSLNNLEWCSHSYNNIHAFELGLKFSNIFIKLINIKTKEILYFRSLEDVKKYLHISHRLLNSKTIPCILRDTYKVESVSFEEYNKINQR